MLTNPREFECTDPFGQRWTVKLLWHQVGIAIRHADTVDCKFLLQSDGEQTEKVIALPHSILKSLAKEYNREISDAWVIKLAAEHLKYMIESGEDLEKTLVTLRADDLQRSQAVLTA